MQLGCKTIACCFDQAHMVRLLVAGVRAGLRTSSAHIHSTLATVQSINMPVGQRLPMGISTGACEMTSTKVTKEQESLSN